jgi:adenine-specific DNA-methyltransferase
MEIIQKFQDLLRNLFQFETSDLDFGIYRILNYKRKQIEKFINKDLVDRVESAFAKHKDERLTNISQRFEDAKQKVIEALGNEAFTPTGELKEEFKGTPRGKDYLSIKAQSDEAETIDEIKLQVFNDLYNFFSRYYEEGDFIPQYRHSIKGHKYTIPYDGEEVKLYWANSDQYYTKTGLLFRDYTFKANQYKIIFRIVSAREELGSKKATKERFFVLDDEKPLELTDETNLVIRFQYRELTGTEVKSYQVEGGSNASKQEKINQRSYDAVLKGVKAIELKERLGKEHKNEKPLLLYQISRFAAKNTKDYFIHKNIKRFLSEQLDYFIKAEVISIDTLEKERFLDKHITRAKVVREIGEAIIDFLSQIENFQKRLWEKKKFVLKTEYVITTDRVPEEFYGEIWSNGDQKKEWKDLGFSAAKSKEDLKRKKLPVDTKHFNGEFKENLIEKLTEKVDLDDILDGLLMKSENYQALNLLQRKYKEKIKSIYIDPPFNSKSTEILYRNFYKHSSWLSLMQNRIWEAKQLLEERGAFICAVDENEQERLGLLLNYIFPGYDRTCVSIIHNPRGIQGENFSYCHEYAYFIYPDVPGTIGTEKRERGWRNLRDNGGESEREYGKNCFYPVLLKNGEIVGFGDVSPEDYHPKAKIVYNEKGVTELWPMDDEGVERKWRYARQSVEKVKHLLRAIERKGTWEIQMKKEEYRYRTVWSDSRYDANEYGSKLLNNMLGDNVTFTFPKSLYNVFDCIHAVTQNDENAIVLDFFGGSGTTAHATMMLNKNEIDGGKRKFIIIEMADYFDTVLIPRIKKACYEIINWKNGKAQGSDGISLFLKYQILEQYEDTLDNIELNDSKQAQLKFGEYEYLLKYFLDYETRENPSILNIDNLKKPFSYKLKANLEEMGEPQEVVVDVPETFNYLFGLKMKRVKTRHYGRKYLFILGEKAGRNIAIVWREYGDEWTEDDFRKDKEFIIKELEPWAPHIVYVNGQSIMTSKMGKHTVEVRYIEPEFKKLMA